MARFGDAPAQSLAWLDFRRTLLAEGCLGLMEGSPAFLHAESLQLRAMLAAQRPVPDAEVQAQLAAIEAAHGAAARRAMGCRG
jgi:hypothetical protein